MALNTVYEYNVDLKTAKIIFCDDGSELSNYAFNDGTITISAIDELVVTPTWGTNKDIKEWYEFLSATSGRLELSEGLVRPGYEYWVKVAAAGVRGKIDVNSNTIGEWEWLKSTGELTIDARSAADINFAEFRSFVQWMQHFQYAVQCYGG